MKSNVRYVSIAMVALVTVWWALQKFGTQTHEIFKDLDLEIPDVWLDHHKPLYNETKVALLIENRPSGILAPLILHMMSVVPPDWRFRFMGSEESVNFVNNSAAIQRQVTTGKLDLTYIPSNMSVKGQEAISRFLTNLWLYETVLHPAEHLLLFQTDSVMCANSLDDLDSWLKYDWVGASFGLNNRGGGNGGLSLRKVSSIIKVLQHQTRRDDTQLEDWWLTERLVDLIGADIANGTESLAFSVEQFWHDTPMGYHTGHSGGYLAQGIWGKIDKRNHIYGYCPEVKMTLDMDLGTFIPKTCHEEW